MIVTHFLLSAWKQWNIAQLPMAYLNEYTYIPAHYISTMYAF